MDDEVADKEAASLGLRGLEKLGYLSENELESRLTLLAAPVEGERAGSAFAFELHMTDSTHQFSN